MLATCEPMAGGVRVFWIVVPPLIALVWVGAMVVLFRRTAPGGRAWLLAILLACGALGAAILVYPHGVQGNGDYLARFEISVVVSACLGAIASRFLPSVGWPKLVGVAVAGDIFVPGSLILLFIWGFAVGNTCLD